MDGPRVRWLLLTALSTVLLSACSALGGVPGERTFYVSPNGDDAARGTSAATAWRTLDRATSAKLVPGDRHLRVAESARE